MRKVTYLMLFMLLLFFPSCAKDVNFKEYLSNSAYEELYTITSEHLEKKLSEEALYYKAAACYYLDRDIECAELSKLCLTLSDNYQNNLLRMLLYKGDLEDAYNSGRKLEELNILNSSDKVQYYRILLKKGYKDEARLLISEIKDILPSYEYAVTVLNDQYSSKEVYDSVLKVFKEEGPTARYINLVKQMIDLIVSRKEFDFINQLIQETFQGDGQYALVLGDYFFSRGNGESARQYWEYAEEQYPNAYKVRMKSFN